MPTDAAEDWMTPVKTAPASSPRRGWAKAVRRREKPGSSARGRTASCMSCIPYMRMAKPTRMRPRSRRRWRRDPSISATPARAARGEKLSGRSRSHAPPALSIPVRARTQGVRVVPMLEPMMTLTVCHSSMTPEFTSPTSITVMAEEDWMATVMTAPSASPLQRLAVRVRSSRSSRPPAIFSRLLDMVVMP